MSVSINLDVLDCNIRQKLAEDLILQYREDTYGKKDDINCLDIQDGNILIPFHYYRENRKIFPKIKNKFTESNNSFLIPLRDSQKQVAIESFDLLNKDKCCILALHCGFGKCFAEDTDILMYDGTIKKVQNIEQFDLVMGDDGTFRKVLHTAFGFDEYLYDIVIPELDITITMNKDHILCLVPPEPKIIAEDDIYLIEYPVEYVGITKKVLKKITRFNSIFDAINYKNKLLVKTIAEKEVINISVKKFISLGLMNEGFRVYKNIIDFQENNNSSIIAKSFRKRREYIKKILTSTQTIYKDESYVISFESDDECSQAFTLFNITGYNAKISGDKIITVFSDNLYSGRDTFMFNITISEKNKYFGFSLDGNNKFVLPNGIISHNTYTSIYLSCKIRYKTMILIHRVLLIEQWVKSISNATPISKIQVVKTGELLDEEADYYIMNSINVPKRKREEYKNIGTLIVDECFTGDTLVITKYRGRIPISELENVWHEEEALSYDMIKGVFIFQKILNFWKRPINNRKIIKLKFEDGNKITCTDNHPFLNKNNEYIRANLLLDEEIIFLHGNQRCVEVSRYNKSMINFVFDIEVKNNNNFTANNAVVHNCHTIATKAFSKAMVYFSPAYCIGLSATPDRSDGMGRMLNLFFSEGRVLRNLHKKHTVYVLRTKYKPLIKYNVKHTLDWNAVIESQTCNQERNDEIASIISLLKDRTILVLCKRVEQSNYLCNKLKELGEDVDIFVRSQTKFDYNSRILISTYSKTGVGFDHPRLDTLLIASDVEEMIGQYHGRVLRREDVEPIIIDIVDDMRTFEKHWDTRKMYYVSTGANIRAFDKLKLKYKK